MCIGTAALLTSLLKLAYVSFFTKWRVARWWLAREAAITRRCLHAGIPGGIKAELMAMSPSASGTLRRGGESP